MRARPKSAGFANLNPITRMTHFDGYLSAMPRPTAQRPVGVWIDARVSAGWSVCMGDIA